MNPLKRRLLRLSPTDYATALDFCEGCLITGSPGGGKSSTVGKQIAHAFLSRDGKLKPNEKRTGGLVLCAKPDEPRIWLNYARECGWDVEKDVILFSADSGHIFDPLFYVFNRPGRGAGDMEAIIDMIDTLLAIGRPRSGEGGNSDRFWELESNRVSRVTLRALQLAGEPISFATMNDFIQSLPMHKDEHLTAEWQRDCNCADVLKKLSNKADRDEFTMQESQDLDRVIRFVFRGWPEMDERVRSSVAATFYGMADKFMYHPLRRLFCSGKCTFVPEMIWEAGKLIIIDFPILEYGDGTARLIQCLIKLLVEQAALRRNIEYDSPVCFIWQDEMQYFILPKGKDNFFQQSCRGARIANVCITQNTMNIAEQLGGREDDAATRSFLGNLMIKIAGQQNEVSSNRYMAELIGQEYQLVRSWDMTDSRPGIHHREDLLFKVPPDTFTRLGKPDTENPLGEFIVYCGGRIFNTTITDQRPAGQNWLRTSFSRNTAE